AFDSLRADKCCQRRTRTHVIAGDHEARAGMLDARECADQHIDALARCQLAEEQNDAIRSKRQALAERAAPNRLAERREVDWIRNDADRRVRDAELLKLAALGVRDRDDAGSAGNDAASEHYVEQSFRDAAPLDDWRGPVRGEHIGNARSAEMMGCNRARHV